MCHRQKDRVSQGRVSRFGTRRLLLLFASRVGNGDCPALFCCICQVLLGSKCRAMLSCYQILITQGTEGLLGKIKLKVWERKSKSISVE